MLALENISGLIVIDEVQRTPDLFPVLRVLADRNKKAKYLILGSASRDLIRQSSETLAGRISYLEIGGFSSQLVGSSKTERLWIRGSFPRSFLAQNEAASYQWRQDFIATFLERDIRRHRELYYTKTPEISDAEFERAERRMRLLCD